MVTTGDNFVHCTKVCIQVEERFESTCCALNDICGDEASSPWREWRGGLFVIFTDYNGPAVPDTAFSNAVVQLLSYARLFFDPMDCSTPGFSVPPHLSESTQVHVHCISDAVQPSHTQIPSSPSALNPSQHQGLFQWVSCSHQMTKILEFQLQHQPFQWVLRIDFP